MLVLAYHLMQILRQEVTIRAMKNVFRDQLEQNHDGTANIVRLIQNLSDDLILQTMNYAWIDEGKRLKEHKHDDCIEYYLFLGGTGEMTIGLEKFAVKKGDFLVVEIGKLHTLVNNGDEKLEFVTVRALLR